MTRWCCPPGRAGHPASPGRRPARGPGAADRARCGRLAGHGGRRGRRAVIVGAGFIGLESAEALRHRGLAVTLVELAARSCRPWTRRWRAASKLELLRAGVAVRLGTSVTALREAGGGTVAADLSDGSRSSPTWCCSPPGSGRRPRSPRRPGSRWAPAAPCWSMSTCGPRCRPSTAWATRSRSPTPSPAARPWCRWPGRPAGRAARR